VILAIADLANVAVYVPCRLAGRVRDSVSREGPVPRSFSLLVLAAIVGGGWYVFKGPAWGN